MCCAAAKGEERATKKRHPVHPVLSEILIHGQLYKLYVDLRNSRGNFFIYFSMSVESFDKLLVLVGPRITYGNTRPRNRIETGGNSKVRKYKFLHITLFQIGSGVA
jgi:hypothetical protein